MESNRSAKIPVLGGLRHKEIEVFLNVLNMFLLVLSCSCWTTPRGSRRGVKLRTAQEKLALEKDNTGQPLTTGARCAMVQGWFMRRLLARQKFEQGLA